MGEKGNVAEVQNLGGHVASAPHATSGGGGLIHDVVSGAETAVRGGSAAAGIVEKKDGDNTQAQ